MSQNVTHWVRKSCIQFGNCSTNQAPYQNNLAENSWKSSLHWNKKAWLTISGLFIFVQYSHQKIDQEIMKNCPHLLKGALTHLKGFVLIHCPLFSKSDPFSLSQETVVKTPCWEWWHSLICPGSFYLIEYCLKALRVKAHSWKKMATEWESALSHWFILNHTSKRDQLN